MADRVCGQSRPIRHPVQTDGLMRENNNASPIDISRALLKRVLADRAVVYDHLGGLVGMLADCADDYGRCADAIDQDQDDAHRTLDVARIDALDRLMNERVFSLGGFGVKIRCLSDHLTRLAYKIEDAELAEQVVQMVAHLGCLQRDVAWSRYLQADEVKAQAEDAEALKAQATDEVAA